MKVSQLVEKLKLLDQDAKVTLADYEKVSFVVQTKRNDEPYVILSDEEPSCELEYEIDELENDLVKKGFDIDDLFTHRQSYALDNQEYHEYLQTLKEETDV